MYLTYMFLHVFECEALQRNTFERIAHLEHTQILI